MSTSYSNAVARRVRFGALAKFWFVIMSALIVTFAGSVTDAATRTWTGSGPNGNWTTSLNWTGSIAPSAGDNLVFPAGPSVKTGTNNFPNTTAFASISIGDNGYTMAGNSITLGTGGISCDNPIAGYAQSALNMPFILPAQRPMTFTGLGDCELSFFGLISGAGGWQIVSTPGNMGHSGVVQLYDGGNSYAGGTSVASSYVGARASGVFGSGPVVMADATVTLILYPGTTQANALTAQGGGFNGNGALSFSGNWSGPITVLNYAGLGSNAVPEMVLSGALTGDANSLVNAPENTETAVVTLTGNSPAFLGKLQPNPGKLNVNAAFPNASADLVNSYKGTTLAGTGSVGGAVTLGPLTHLAPGYNGTVGVLSTGSLTLPATSILDIRINGTTPGTNQSQVNVTGSVTLGGTLNVILQPGYVVPLAASYTVIANDGVDAVSGTFAGLAEGAAFTASGVPFVITYAGGSGNDVVITAQARTLAVAVTGSGVGNVSGTGVAPINCGNGGVVCVQSNPPGAFVTLTATPNGTSTFTGWTGGGCLLINPCSVFINGSPSVQATFAPTANGPFNLDIDNNTPVTTGPQRAATDGLMILRYLFGLTGSAITANAMGPSPGRAAGLVPAHLANIRPLLDIDGNGQIDALTDGLLIVRYMLGVTGPALISGALGPNATRPTASAIQMYLDTYLPP